MDWYWSFAITTGWTQQAESVLISTISTPLVQTGERKLTQFFTVWPWPLTYDLDLQSQASQGHGRPSCQKSMSKVKRFKPESARRQTDGHTCITHTIIIVVTNMWRWRCWRRWRSYVTCWGLWCRPITTQHCVSCHVCGSLSVTSTKATELLRSSMSHSSMTSQLVMMWWQGSHSRQLVDCCRWCSF